jgi:hypothetical protein
MDKSLSVRKFAVVEALTLPPVRLAVKPQLAVDLPAVLPQRPDVFTWRWLSRWRRCVELEPVVISHVADRSAVGCQGRSATAYSYDFVRFVG